MKKEEQVVSSKVKNELQLTQDLEMELTSLDESMVPSVIAERMNNVAVINEKYEVALKKKNAAQKKVDTALNKAESLIKKAESLGELDVKTHKFFKREWSSKGDRIAALEKCVKSIGEYGSDTAELQKSIVEIQNATLESQEAIMNVQKYQMEYMEGTTKAMKFLYGLSAYGIASTESIVANMDLILHGIKKKDLGEMAKQQMYLVMDQIKSQENLHSRMDKTEDGLEGLREELRLRSEEDNERDRRILEREEKDREQDKLLKVQASKDREHDKAIAAGKQKDIEQDKLLKAQVDKDREHDKAIVAGEQKDAEQDKLLKAQVEKDLEHDKAIAAGERKDAEQDKLLKAQAEKNREHDKAIAAGERRDAEQYQLLKAQAEIGKNHEKRLVDADARIRGLSEKLAELNEKNTELERWIGTIRRIDQKRNWKKQIKRRR